MAEVLVTGATGLVGSNLVRALLLQKRTVRCLVRSMEKGRRLLPSACELVVGDVCHQDSLMSAVKGCSVVYHAAGIPEQWVRDPRIFEDVNAQGTRNMIDASLVMGCKRFMFFSTIDIFDVAPGAHFDESALLGKRDATPYGRSKWDADRAVFEALSRGLPAVFLHPAAIYGPGPTDSPGLNRFFKLILENQVPAVVPGGLPLVFAEDLVDAALVAERRAEIGERFILSESFLTFPEIARIANEALGKLGSVSVLPYWIATMVATLTQGCAYCFGTQPLLHKGQLQVAQWGARPSSKRSMARLGWSPRSFRVGVRETLAFLDPLHSRPDRMDFSSLKSRFALERSIKEKTL